MWFCKIEKSAPLVAHSRHPYATLWYIPTGTAFGIGLNTVLGTFTATGTFTIRCIVGNVSMRKLTFPSLVTKCMYEHSRMRTNLMRVQS